MTIALLACGPYFRPDGLILSLIVLVVLKPLAYYAFVQAFRYRVSWPVPMTAAQAGSIATVRAVIGALAIVAGAIALHYFDGVIWWEWSRVYLYMERTVVWTWLGYSMAKLRSRRLLGWTLSGTLLNAAFDFSIWIGLLAGFFPPIVVLAAIAVFIVALHTAGRRATLLERFADPHCVKCAYNLTGNLSGICPECGTPVAETVAVRAQAG